MGNAVPFVTWYLVLVDKKRYLYQFLYPMLWASLATSLPNENFHSSLSFGCLMRCLHPINSPVSVSRMEAENYIERLVGTYVMLLVLALDSYLKCQWPSTVSRILIVLYIEIWRFIVFYEMRAVGW